MKKIVVIAVFLAVVQQISAQEKSDQSGFNLPITVSIFSESIGLPNFRFSEGQTNLGFRVGTEFYYKESDKRQLIQTVNIGFYSHKGFQNTLFLNSEFGYRHNFNKVFLDGTIGFGYALIRSALPKYKWNNSSFESQSPTSGRFFPTIGLGAGYQFNGFSLFSRYEMYGEMPFGLKGIPALPHAAFHLGSRFQF